MLVHYLAKSTRLYPDHPISRQILTPLFRAFLAQFVILLPQRLGHFNFPDPLILDSLWLTWQDYLHSQN